MSDEPIAFQLFTEIGIIDQLAGTAFDRALPRGITRAQFAVLHHFVRRELTDQSPAQLAQALQVTRATMTSTLGRMKRAGLVTVQGDPIDGRAKRVALTPLGRATRDQCIAAVAPLLSLVSQTLELGEFETVLHLLRRLRLALDRARDPAP
ncbi:MAG: MarR family transcriptional regulator [Casimicrobium sp.]